MNKYAIIVAAGSGNRMNSDVPKQFLILKGKPVLYYSIAAFLLAYDDCKIILVLSEEHTAMGQEIVDAYFGYARITLAIGGRTRFHSVQNGLKQITDKDCIIFVHDAARPMISQTFIKSCYEKAMETGSAIPVINCKDSVRIITEDGNEALERSKIKLVQTPQTFHGKILLPAFFNIDYKDTFTDEASVVEAFGLKLSLVQGEENNIKITQQSDLLLAEIIMND